MAYKVAGGTKWWQVRAGKGLEGEWIVTKKDWRDAQKEDKQKAKANDGIAGEDGEMKDNGECELVYAGQMGTDAAYSQAGNGRV